MKYRKKAVEIEAVQFTTTKRALDFVGDCGFSDVEVRNCSEKHPEGFDYPCIKIKTLEGVMTASLGDYIIKGVKGEFYPCKPDIFHLTYEKIE